jgi:single-strand DNA-binding protein
MGATVCNFSLATTERIRNKDGNYEDKTEWHNIVMWRGLAEVAAKYLRKGSTVYLEGKLTTRSWDGPDGQKKYRTEVEVSEMTMLDGRNENRLEGLPGQESRPYQPNTPSAREEVADYSGSSDLGEDDLPF